MIDMLAWLLANIGSIVVVLVILAVVVLIIRRLILDKKAVKHICGGCGGGCGGCPMQGRCHEAGTQRTGFRREDGIRGSNDT